MWRDEQSCDVFKIAKRIVKTNQYVIGEQFIRNDVGVLAVRSEDKKIAWKSYHKKLLSTGFAWDRNSLSQAASVSGVTKLIDKNYEEWKGCRSIRFSV